MFYIRATALAGRKTAGQNCNNKGGYFERYLLRPEPIARLNRMPAQQLCNRASAVCRQAGCFAAQPRLARRRLRDDHRGLPEPRLGVCDNRLPPVHHIQRPQNHSQRLAVCAMPEGISPRPRLQSADLVLQTDGRSPPINGPVGLLQSRRLRGQRRILRQGFQAAFHYRVDRPAARAKPQLRPCAAPVRWPFRRDQSAIAACAMHGPASIRGVM